MIKYFTFICFNIILIPFTQSFAQNLIWQHSMGDTSSILGDYTNGIAYDNNGDLIVAGSYTGTMKPNPANASYTISATGVSNSYVAKYSNTGNFLWVKQIQGPSYESIYAMDLDANGNIYITGTFASTADFDPGPAVANLTSFGNSSNIFIAKYDNNGNYKWAKSIGSSGNTDNGLDIVVDYAGNVIVTGHFTGATVFEPNTANAALTSLGGMDAFVVKFDSIGGFQWVRGIGSAPHWERGKKVEIDNNNNIYVLGEFASTIDVDPSSAVMNIAPLGGTDGDVFFIKYNPQGQPIWAKTFGKAGQFDVEPTIAIHNNAIYLAGAVQDSVDFDLTSSTYFQTPISSSSKGFIAKYDLNSQLIWIKQYQDSAYSRVDKLFVTNNNEIVVGGVFKDYNTTFNVNFNSSATSYTTNAFWESPFVAIYDTNMNYAESWVLDCTQYASFSDLLLQGNSVYVTGNFEDTMDMDPGSANSMNISNGFRDIFLGKYNLANPTKTATLLEKEFDYAVYPNPTSNKLHISLHSKTRSNVHIDVFDVLGRSYKSALFQTSVGNNSYMLDVNGLPSGIYSVHLTDDLRYGSVQTEKIIIQR